MAQIKARCPQCVGSAKLILPKWEHGSMSSLAFLIKPCPHCSGSGEIEILAMDDGGAYLPSAREGP
jgi:hypothetical protein